MKHYNLNGAERGCYDCGKQYLQCTCWNKPKAIINETPVYQIGDEVCVYITDHCKLAKITAIRYPVYTTNTSWNGAPVIVTDYQVQFADDSTEWFSWHDLYTI
jgi:hypothetical protein